MRGHGPLRRVSRDASAIRRAHQDKIFNIVGTDLESSERLVCPPVAGTFSPWTAFVSRHGLVRSAVRVAALPITLAWSQGRPASFVVTDSRFFVVTRLPRTHVASLPLVRIVQLTDGVVTSADQYGHESDLFYEIKLAVEGHGQLCLRFGQLSAGSTLTNALFRQHTERFEFEIAETLRSWRQGKPEDSTGSLLDPPTGTLGDEGDESAG
jgi:hypothetical protein